MSETTSPYPRRPARKGSDVTRPERTGETAKVSAKVPPVMVAAGVDDTIRNASTRVPIAEGGPGSLSTATSAATPAPRSRWKGYLLVLGVALLVVGGRVAHDSWAALRAGEAAAARGDRATAAREYQHAVRMYLPGSPFVARALHQLEQLAGAAASAGDLGGERQAWEAMRSGLLGARSVYTPYPGRLAIANRRLASLYAQIEEERVAPGASAAQRQRWHADRLAVQPGPAVPATLAALLGLGLWLGAAVAFIRRGVDRGLRLDRRWAGYCGLGFLVGFTLFVVGLRLA